MTGRAGHLLLGLAALAALFGTPALVVGSMLLLGAGLALAGPVRKRLHDRKRPELDPFGNPR